MAQATDAAEIFSVTPKCVVTVRADGLQLQGLAESAPLYIGLPILHVLAALSTNPASIDEVVEEVAGRLAIDPVHLVELLPPLRFRGVISRSGSAGRRELQDHPTFGGAAPLSLDSPQLVALRLPLVLRTRDGLFEIVDHDGFRRAALTPAEVDALESLIEPATPRAAFDAARLRPGADSSGIDPEQFEHLLGTLADAGLLATVTAEGSPLETRPSVDRDVIIREVFSRHAAAQRAAEADRERRTGEHRPKVVPVAFDMGAPAGLGMVIAYAKAFEDGRLDEVYDFRTDWVWSDQRIPEFTAEPAIYLFSNYLWSHERCIAVSRRVKELSPSSITIHGGPDTPKYERDSRDYFDSHPHVDVTIRGEGEVTAAETLAALAGVIGDAEPDLSVLAGVPGVTYRDGDRIVRNPDRDRVGDVNILPSPFLTGLFDVFTQIPDLFVTIETNRGCPYSCTFCDWGSATASRVRLFDIERVFAELDWCSSTETQSVSVADANFGMYKRDVEIAQRVADLKLANNFPRAFGVSYAKNTVKHLQEIIRALSSAGIMTQGVLSLQSMDLETLNIIRRSNIKTERYDGLADEMRRARLPLMVELMMGLPGQTVESFAEDLQQCINREVPARINHTTLLVNSPMNDPEYLAEHRIETAVRPGDGRDAIVISTSSFSHDDYRAMENLRLGFMTYENYGVLRLISRFVRQETGLREIDLYRDLRDASEKRMGAWPSLYVLTHFGSAMMAAPYSWALLMDDLRAYLVSEHGVADDTALDAVLRAQRALLPAHGRSFPETVPLEHDVVEWYAAMLSAKGGGHRDDWPDIVPRLGEYGPGELVVDDPDHIVETSLGMNRELSVVGVNWEFDSPLSRARLASTQLVDWVTDLMLPKRAAGKEPATT